MKTKAACGPIYTTGRGRIVTMNDTRFKSMRQKIKDALMYYYADIDLSKISIRMICEKVGIARTTFYNYYSDIYEVLEEIEDKFIDDLRDLNRTFYYAPLKPGEEEGEAYFDPTLTYIRENGDYFRVLLSEGRDSQFIYKWKNIIKRDFESRYDRESIRLSNRDLVLEMIASGVIGSYTYWVNHFNDVPVKTIREELLSMYCSDFL